MLHYGSEYLADAIKSIDPFVEKINILYGETPSHQAPVEGAICPDTRAELQIIANEASNKINWIDVNPKSKRVLFEEHQHLAKAFLHADKADMMLRIDADEVWNKDSLQDCIDKSWDLDSRYIGIYGFVNFWRSLDHVVIDRFGPIRIHNMKSSNRKPEFLEGTIYHFGYAVTEASMKYKLGIHGHKDHWKPGWLERWLDWTPETVGENWHPCTDAYWHTVDPFDKYQLPEYMHTHKYFNTEIIK
jgi:hypothetical protein